VVRELNSGATATVYAALDTASQPPGRSVAIKVTGCPSVMSG
jgi:hypothetical protein